MGAYAALTSAAMLHNAAGMSNVSRASQLMKPKGRKGFGTYSSRMKNFHASASAHFGAADRRKNRSASIASNAPITGSMTSKTPKSKAGSN